MDEKICKQEEKASEKECKCNSKKWTLKRPIFEKSYDITTAYYADKKDTEPKYKYHSKGSFRLDFVRLAAGIGAILALFGILSIFSKKD